MLYEGTQKIRGPQAQVLAGEPHADQGPPSGHRLFLLAATDKGHFQTAGLLHQGWPFLSCLAATAAGTLNLPASPGKISSSQALPFPFANFCSLRACLQDKVMGQDKSPYS